MLSVNPLQEAAVARIGGGATPEAREKLALQELERLFAFLLMKEVRRNMPRDTLLGGGFGQEVYEEMMDDALCAEIARSGQLGIARQIEAQLREADVRRSVQPGGPARPGAPQG